MPKTLENGRVVSSADYYALLDWKDKNMDVFRAFCVNHDEPSMSLNRMREESYNLLIIRYLPQK